MNGNRRVLWGEGLFLRPQHFQRQDAFHDGRVREVMADLHPYAWGIRASRVDVGALRNGVFRLESLSAIFPDGETVNAPDSDPLPEAIGLDALPDNTSSVVIHAAIPRFKNHGGNLGADGNGLSRYVKTTAQTADLFTDASEAEIAGFVRAVGTVARQKGLVEPGYRLLANIGAHGGQEVPHLHVHLFGGEPLGPMIARR